mgnify:CR=1 FL=1
MEDQQIIDLYLTRDERTIAETDKKYGAFCIPDIPGAMKIGEEMW